ncbi:hypothetical protein BDP81DRAFT_474801 [Colletotrichum phormii]|uniref:Uncharacterized protein n=1 Tax=Colletotrichum phormii TaxID=359342 RepID=A0AAJ0EA36_9PEZI|nr:uncharacterized protein BDP81DRAFT_474801 [Colletotrichum phormii]KAK1624674.1 hypothetical protein BDP81DRAFT_474801 [Colletotrichum phormii]
MAKDSVIPIFSSPEDEAAIVPLSHKSSSRLAKLSPSIERKKRKKSKQGDETPESPKSFKKPKIKFRPSSSKHQKRGSPKPMTPSPLATYPLARRPSHSFIKRSTIDKERKPTEPDVEPLVTVEAGDTVEADDANSEDKPMASTSHTGNSIADQAYAIPEQPIRDKANPDLSTQLAQKLEPSTHVPGKETLTDDDNCYISKAAFNLLTSRHVTLQHMVMTFIDSVNDLQTTSKVDRNIRDGILAEAKSLQMGIKAVSNAAFQLPWPMLCPYSRPNWTSNPTNTLATIDKFNEKKRINAAVKAAAAAQQAAEEGAEMADNDGSEIEVEPEDEEEVEDIEEEQTANTDGEPMDESEQMG